MSTYNVSTTNRKNSSQISPTDSIDGSTNPWNKDKKELQPVRRSMELPFFRGAVVQRAIDGDTIELTNRTRVRLIGINTSESTYKIETYGKEARNYIEEKLAGRTVWLQIDISEGEIDMEGAPDCMAGATGG